MSFLRSSWFPILLGLVILIVILNEVLRNEASAVAPPIAGKIVLDKKEWRSPDIDTVPDNEFGRLIRYGRDLIANTSKYLGPKGSVAALSNGMNCQNCHAEAGIRPFGNCFSAVASTYPRFRNRSGKIESIEFRVNECMERSLNGKKLDSLSREMRAMVAYMNWVGAEVPSGVRPTGAGTEELPFLSRAANVQTGQSIYISKCQLCHGINGEGKINFDSTGFLYPPLWGPESYNVSAGLYRLSSFAGYVKNNMPFGATHENPQLGVEEAWDVAAFVNSQPRPRIFFKYDWPDIRTKPLDHPFGPYADGFSEKDHKYGPFLPIKQARDKLLASSKTP